MTTISAAAPRPWPTLREDLTLHPGPPDATGAATWTLHDPARNLYFSIDWIAFHVVSRLALGNAAAVLSSIRADTPLQHLGEDDVAAVIAFLEENELVQRHDAQSATWLRAKRDARKPTFWKSLIHNYLFFRIPLFRVDQFLGYLAPRLAFVWKPFFLKLTAAVLLLGVWGVIRQWDAFTATLIDTFSWEGIAGFAGALIAVKVLHEFGHGLTAKRFGCKVPYMGVAFLVMWPMAYTDVTESWKLDSHRKRLIISSAGIVTELVVAAWALLAWSLLPDGGLRSAVFFLSTTSIVATLAINASPFMRFDGYFLLCDIVGMPNLHQRSFAVARWWLREKLFRLGDSPPEGFTQDKQTLLIGFAIATWLYRFVVFLGIALLVYNFFFKALGIALMVIEVWYFIARPVWNEIAVWQKRWPDIAPVVKDRPAFYVGAFLLAVFLLPFDFTVNSQGLSKPEQALRVITFQPSQVVKPPPGLGVLVSPGQEVMVLESPELEHRIRLSEVKVQTLFRQFQAAGFDQETLVQQSVIRERLNAAQEELRGLISERSRLRPVANFSGRVVDIDPDLYAGAWLARNTHVLTVINDDDWIVDTYVTDAELSRIDIGNWARFVPQGVGLSAAWGRVADIDTDTTRVMTDGPLTSFAGGEVLVRQQNNRVVPERAVYRVRIKLDRKPGMETAGVLRGRVTILGYPKSIAGDVVRGSIATLVREAGF